MSLVLALTQQCGFQAGSDPSEGLFQRPKCLLQHHRLTLAQITTCAPGLVPLKKPLGAGPHVHLSQSKSNRAASQYTKVQPHRLSRVSFSRILHAQAQDTMAVLFPSPSIPSAVP